MLFRSDQNYQVDPWEESLLEKILFDPQGASPAQAKMAKELSKVSAIAMKAEETSEQSQDMPKAWSRYLTWVQGERNERPDGRPRIDINQPDLKKLHQELSQVLSLAEANFLIAVRQYGTAVSKRPQSLSAIQSQSTNQKIGRAHV